jgi:hypothetical protein
MSAVLIGGAGNQSVLATWYHAFFSGHRTNPNGYDTVSKRDAAKLSLKAGLKDLSESTRHWRPDTAALIAATFPGSARAGDGIIVANAATTTPGERLNAQANGTVVLAEKAEIEANATEAAGQAVAAAEKRLKEAEAALAKAKKDAGIQQ